MLLKLLLLSYPYFNHKQFIIVRTRNISYHQYNKQQFFFRPILTKFDIYILEFSHIF